VGGKREVRAEQRSEGREVRSERRKKGTEISNSWLPFVCLSLLTPLPSLLVLAHVQKTAEVI
jgi:hypothetical protein